MTPSHLTRPALTLLLLANLALQGPIVLDRYGDIQRQKFPIHVKQ
jgi:hypothetical protein